MSFQPDPRSIRWRLHFQSPPEEVYRALSTDEGRASFWAESAVEFDDVVEFVVLGYPRFRGRILQREPPRAFVIEYFDSKVTFRLESDGHGGTDLELLAEDVDPSLRWEMTAGWVSVLLAMKAAVDFGVDLRNHDESRTWQTGYADN
jgi:uncharacterized protein YndB with AHSA1/START domain